MAVPLLPAIVQQLAGKVKVSYSPEPAPAPCVQSSNS